jgi:mycoredoxin
MKTILVFIFKKEETMEKTGIKVYGTSWCGDTRRVRQYFEINHIDYEWIDIDGDDQASEFVKQVNNGNRSVPTIVFPDGTTLTEPSTYSLKEKIDSLG